MTFARLLAALILGAILLVSLGASLVALILAAHAALTPLVGGAFAWALLLGLLAAMLAVTGVVASRVIGPRRIKPAAVRSDDPQAAAVRFARDQPLVAVAVAVLGVLLAARSPRYLGAAARAFLYRQRPPGA